MMMRVAVRAQWRMERVVCFVFVWVGRGGRGVEMGRDVEGFGRVDGFCVSSGENWRS